MVLSSVTPVLGEGGTGILTSSWSPTMVGKGVLFRILCWIPVSVI